MNTLAYTPRNLNLIMIKCYADDTGAFDTVTGGMTSEQAEGMFKGFGKSIPAGRSGEPADMGNAVLFLLTNNFMTGCILDVDGGKTLQETKSV